MSLVSVLADITAIAAKPETGIVASLNEPPETMGKTWPVSWPDPASGTTEPGADYSFEHYRIRLLVYVTPREKQLPVEFARMAPLIDSVKRTFRQAFKDGEYPPNVSKAWVTNWQTGIRDWGSDEWHTIDFTIEVDEEEVDE